jgi:hypothetical protein
MRRCMLYRSVVFLTVILFLAGSTSAQTEQRKPIPSDGRPVMWQPVDISKRDLYLGPGGTEMRPDVSSITSVKNQPGGHQRKYRIKDAAGRTWVAKLGREAQPETAAVRILWGLGYKTEINYLIPNLTIPGKGNFKNVRLEARPHNIKRLERWSWRNNPFMGRNEFQGLKIMQVFFEGWDTEDIQNVILQIGDGPAPELDYVISDLGSTFGKLGSNNLPMFWRLGRSVGNQKAYEQSGFIKGVVDGKLQFDAKGKNRSLYGDITVAHGRWLADLLMQLSDQQIRDAFRAANYSAAEAEAFTAAVKRRINELDRATGSKVGLLKNN